jgi:hypothetical protein
MLIKVVSTDLTDETDFVLMQSRKVPSPLRGEDKGEGVFQDEIKVVGQAWQSLLDKTSSIEP